MLLVVVMLPRQYSSRRHEQTVVQSCHGLNYQRHARQVNCAAVQAWLQGHTKVLFGWEVTQQPGSHYKWQYLWHVRMLDIKGNKSCFSFDDICSFLLLSANMLLIVHSYVRVLQVSYLNSLRWITCVPEHQNQYDLLSWEGLRNLLDKEHNTNQAKSKSMRTMSMVSDDGMEEYHWLNWSRTPENSTNVTNVQIAPMCQMST